MTALAAPRPDDHAMRRAVIGSAVVHAAFTAAALFARARATIAVPGTESIEVALVDASTLGAPRPAAKAPEPAPALEERGVRIEKRPRHESRPAPAPPAPTPAARPAEAAPTAARVVLPYADVGGGLRGQVAVDASNFEFAYYLMQVRSLIARAWTPPAGVASGTHADVYFRAARDGSISEPRIEATSGNAYFDQAALRAVIVAGHLPPLPAGYDGSDLGIHFGFEYTGP